MAEPLALDRVTIHLNGVRLLAVDADVSPGETLTVMGPSGSGKSTLLSFVTGTLDRGFAAAGRVRLGDRDVTDLATEDRGIGILFQDDLLFPHLNVAQNLGFGLRGAPRRDRAQAIEAALAEVGLEGLGGRDPATLSGGQKARVALMRTLLAKPSALLLDEPFSRLDADRRDLTRRMVFDTVRRRGLPAILVTHDPGDAAAAGGRVIRLD